MNFIPIRKDNVDGSPQPIGFCATWLVVAWLAVGCTSVKPTFSPAAGTSSYPPVEHPAKTVTLDALPNDAVEIGRIRVGYLEDEVDDAEVFRAVASLAARNGGEWTVPVRWTMGDEDVFAGNRARDVRVVEGWTGLEMQFESEATYRRTTRHDRTYAVYRRDPEAARIAVEGERDAMEEAKASLRGREAQAEALVTQTLQRARVREEEAVRYLRDQKYPLAVVAFERARLAYESVARSLDGIRKKVEQLFARARGLEQKAREAGAPLAAPTPFEAGVQALARGERALAANKLDEARIAGSEAVAKFEEARTAVEGEPRKADPARDEALARRAEMQASKQRLRESGKEPKARYFRLGEATEKKADAAFENGDFTRATELYRDAAIYFNLSE